MNMPRKLENSEYQNCLHALESEDFLLPLTERTNHMFSTRHCSVIACTLYL